MKVLIYLLWFLFGVILFYIFNTIYYKLQENFTIGAPIFKILQDNTTGNYSFLMDDNVIPDNQRLLNTYDLTVSQSMLNQTGIFGSDMTQYNGPDPRTIINPNNPFYDSSIAVLDRGCPILPTIDPSKLPDGYKVIMIPITKTNDFEILFGLYDPLLAVDYNAGYGQSACAPLPRRSNNEVILEQLYQNCLNTDYVNMSNTTFNETQVIFGFLRVYDLCRTYELLERQEHETENYMNLKNLQTSLETMNTFVLDYSEKKEFIKNNKSNYDNVIFDNLYDRSTMRWTADDNITYTKYSDNTYHLTLIQMVIRKSTSDTAWDKYIEFISNSQRSALSDINESKYEQPMAAFTPEQINDDLDFELQAMRLNERDFNIVYEYTKNKNNVIENVDRFKVYNIYLDKYYRARKIADFSGSSDTQELPSGNNVIVYLSAIVKDDLPDVTSCEEIITLGFDNFRVSAQAFVMSLVVTSQSITDLIQMGYCTSNLYRTGFKILDGLQGERMPQTALKLHLNVVQNLQTGGIVLNNLLVSPLPSMMKVLRDHLCIAYNIPMGIVSLGFQDDKNNPHFTFMDKHLMELDIPHRMALFQIVEILFSNPAYLNRAEGDTSSAVTGRADPGIRVYIDYPPDKLKPTIFDLKELIFLFEHLKNNTQIFSDLADANTNFSIQIKILFDVQADSPNTSFEELPRKLLNQEIELLTINKGTDISGLISQKLLDTSRYNFTNNRYQYRDDSNNCVQLFFGLRDVLPTQPVVCLDLDKVRQRLTDVKTHDQPTIFSVTPTHVKTINPLLLNNRKLSLYTDFQNFAVHVDVKRNQIEYVNNDITNFIYIGYLNNLCILERQIIYQFILYYIEDDDPDKDEFIRRHEIESWEHRESRIEIPYGTTITIVCTLMELIEMYNLRVYSFKLYISPLTFNYKRGDKLLTNLLEINFILTGTNPNNGKTIYIVLRNNPVSMIWKPIDQNDPDEKHYRYMLHYGSCNPSDTTVPCQITDQMYVRYYNPALRKLIGIKKGDGLLNVAYDGMISRPINTDESNNFSEFTYDLATEVKFKDADLSFSDTLAGLNFDSNTDIELNTPIQFGLIQRKAHTFGASIGIYHPREYTLINSETDQSTLQYRNPDKIDIFTDILLSSIQGDSINIRTDDTCLFNANNGVYISFEYTQDGIKSENLFIQFDDGTNTQSKQYRLLELLTSLQ